MATSSPLADGYVIFNFFVPLRRGMRFEDGLTFEGKLWGRGPVLVNSLPAVYPTTEALPPLDSPMKGSIRIRFLRTHAPHENAVRTDWIFPLALQVLGRPAAEGSINTTDVIGDVIETVAQIQASSPCKLGSRGSMEQAAKDTFDWGLGILREIQYRYRETTETIAVAATRENVPEIVTMNRVAYDPDGKTVEDPGMGVYTTGGTDIPELNLDNLDTNSLEQLVFMPWSLDDGRLFERFNTFSLDAREILWMTGDYRNSVLNAAIAAECIFDDVLSFMLWWERETPQIANQTLVKPIYKKVKSDYLGRLGGVWTTARRGPVANWHRHIARIRDRIVHGGYHPSRTEAYQALTALAELRKFLADRVIARKSIERYPHLSLLLLGPTGLRKSGHDPSAVLDWHSSPDDNEGRLANWRAISRRLRVEAFSSSGSVEPEIEQCEVIALVEKSQIRHFAADSSFALVSEVTIPGMKADEMARLRAIQEQLADDDHEVLSFIEFGSKDRIRMSNKWVPMEEVLPLFLYMRP